MWSETVGLGIRPVLVLVLVLQVWWLVLCCETRSCYARCTMILKDITATFQVPVLFIVSLFCASNITTVQINSDTFTYLKVKSAKCLCLLPVMVLVLRIWSCLHHCFIQPALIQSQAHSRVTIITQFPQSLLIYTNKVDCMFVTDKFGSLGLPPHMIHIPNHHVPGSALVHNSFALAVC